jgi:hypothetical protein
MPTLEELTTRYRNDTMTDRDRVLFDTLVNRGEIPSPGPTVEQIDRHTISADADAVGSIRANSIAAIWLESQGYNSSGQGFFDADGELDGLEKLKRIQNAFNPGRHADVGTDYDKFMAMDREKQLEQAETFEAVTSKEGLNVLAGTVSEVTSSLMALQNPFADKALVAEREQAKIEATRFRLLQKDFMKMRSMYERQVQSTASREFVQAAVDGVWDQDFFEGLPADEKPFIAPYVRLMKATSERNVASQAIGAVVGGVWDIATDTVVGVADKGIDAALSAGDLLGARKWRNALGWVREARADVRREQEAMATKFAERVPGPGGVGATGKLARSGKLGKFQKLVSNLPVAMATVSMAKQFEGQMIERGVDPDLAGAAAMPVSIVNMYVEKAALDQFLGIGKGALAGATQEFIAKRMFKAGVKGAVQALTFETAEEIIQAYNEELVTQGLLGEVSLDELNTHVANTVAEIAPTMAVFAAFGGGMGGLRNMSVEEYSDNSTANSVYKEKIKEIDSSATEADKKAVRAQIFQEWREAPQEEQEAVLRRNGVANVEEAKPT